MMLVIMLLSEGASHNAQITKSDGIVDNLQGSHGPAVMKHRVSQQDLQSLLHPPRQVLRQAGVGALVLLHMYIVQYFIHFKY